MGPSVLRRVRGQADGDRTQKSTGHCRHACLFWILGHEPGSDGHLSASSGCCFCFPLGLGRAGATCVGAAILPGVAGRVGQDARTGSPPHGAVTVSLVSQAGGEVEPLSSPPVRGPCALSRADHRPSTTNLHPTCSDLTLRARVWPQWAAEGSHHLALELA